MLSAHSSAQTMTVCATFSCVYLVMSPKLPTSIVDSARATLRMGSIFRLADSMTAVALTSGLRPIVTVGT